MATNGTPTRAYHVALALAAAPVLGVLGVGCWWALTEDRGALLVGGLWLWVAQLFQIGSVLAIGRFGPEISGSRRAGAVGLLLVAPWAGVILCLAAVSAARPAL